MRYLKLIRPSTLLLILTALQFIYTVAIATGAYTSKHFSLEHEDTIFIMHLMTWFIVYTIEQVAVKLSIEAKDMR